MHLFSALPFLIGLCASISGRAGEAFVLERGPHHRVVARVIQATNLAGEQVTFTNTYVELGSGMHYIKDGRWETATPVLEPAAEGAVVKNASYGAKFKTSLASAEPAIFTLPDGQVLRTRVSGLSYFDAATGEAVLLAEPTDCRGEILGENKIRYANCFDDVAADLEYVLSLSGWEQNVILREEIPSPAAYGLNPDSTRLQILTEFITPPPAQSGALIPTPDGLVDQTVIFGGMRLNQGKAFLTAPRVRNGKNVPIAKLYKKLNARDFLIEEMQYTNARPQLRTLPAARAHALRPAPRKGRGKDVLLALKPHLDQFFLVRTHPDARRTMEVAALPAGRRPGFLCDYSISGYLTNFTFCSATTYHVTNMTYLAGNCIIEGRTVIKSSVSFDFYDESIVFNDPNGTLEWRTSEYQPAVFTSKNDNTIGETIEGSTGNPVSGEYAAALSWNTPGDFAVHDARFLYASIAFQAPAWSRITARNIQIVDCEYGIGFSGSLELFNALFSRVDTALLNFSGNLSATAEFLTVDQGSLLSWNHPLTNAQFTLRNTLLQDVILPNIPMTQSCVATVQPSDFVMAGAGAYYLAENSSLRNTGVSNSLPFSIRSRTTHAPLTYSNALAVVPTLLEPRAQRDTDQPDPGFHYAPIDVISCAFWVSNAPLTLSNGVVVAAFDESAILLKDRAPFISIGLPTLPNRLVDYRTVQEQPRKIGTLNNSAMNMVLPVRPAPNGANVTVRFTDFIRMTGPNPGNDLYGNVNWQATAFDVQDCNFHGGGVSLWQGATNVLCRNNLFEHSRVYFCGDMPLHFANNTVIGQFCYWGCYREAPWPVHDNIFAGANVGDDGDYEVDHRFNAYVNCANWFWSGLYNGSETNLAAITWDSGPLGNYYVPANSPVVDCGSLTNAALAGFYYYTMHTNQVLEGSSRLDLGKHYLVVNEFGTPVDLNGDGSPDYLSDRNGNGIADYLESAMGFDPGGPNGLGVTVPGYEFFLANPRPTPPLP